MGHWLAYIGGGDERATFQSVLGGAGRVQCGPGAALGIVNVGGEPVVWTEDIGGRITARIGSADAGCKAVLNPSRSELTITRDPFGLRGVYALTTGGGSWFASDIRLLQKLPDVPTRLSAAALHGYLCFSYVPSPLTPIVGISQLPPGSRLRVSQAGQSLEPMPKWREMEPVARDEEDTVQALRTRLQDAVERRIGNTTRVGVYLSGGLDSSLIAALLVRAGVRPNLFTLDFGPPFDAELPYARQVAAHLGLPLHVVQARPTQIRKALEATMAVLHQPFGDGVTVPLYLLGQAAAREVEVVFNGEGGDQLFAGWANKPMIAAELYGAPEYDRTTAYLATFHRFLGLTDKLYTPEAREVTRDLNAADWVRPALQSDPSGSLLHLLRAANLQLKGAQNIAPRCVQLAEAHGLRLEAPFFDQELARWTFGLPPESFLNGACEKYLLKRAAEAYLPPEIVWREKQGMGVPTTEWCMAGPLRREAGHWLSPNRLKRDGWFNPAEVDRLRCGNDEPGEFRRRRLGEKLWVLLALHVWRDVQAGPPAWPTEPCETGRISPVFWRIRRHL